MTIARGIRNANPGNIRRSNDPWQGLAKVQSDPEFFTFQSPEFGIRAICRILISYRDKRQLNTVRQIISRWAPPEGGNDTAAYVKAVSGSTGLDPDEPIDVHEYGVLRALVVAIIKHENGQQPYSGEVINKGLAMAGIIVGEAPRPAVASPTVISGTVSAISTSAVPVISDQVQHLQATLSPLADSMQWVKYALIALAVTSAVLTIIYRIREQPRML